MQELTDNPEKKGTSAATSGRSNQGAPMHPLGTLNPNSVQPFSQDMRRHFRV